MESSKIHLSSAEMDLVCNVDIILTKNLVLKKIKGLLEEVQQMQLAYVNDRGLEFHSLFTVPPKISKGENYLGLPYLVLDYPRISSTDNFFFIRSFFWWGRFFSSTLQAGGISKDIVYKNVDEKINQFKKSNYFISVNSDPWVHHFEASNYQPIITMKEDQWKNYQHHPGHMKIAIKWPLDDWHLIANKLFESWKFLLETSGLIS